MVGFNYRPSPAIAYARQLIAEGQLGSPYQLRIKYLQDWGMSGAQFVWRFERRRAGSGAIGDIGSHAIDCAEYLMGPIRRVLGRLANFTAERALPGGEGPMGWVGRGEAAALIPRCSRGGPG